MSVATYLVTQAVSAFLEIMMLLLIVRALLSWLPLDDDSPLVIFIYNVTEMVIFPVRSILERSETIASMPIDISSFVTFFLLSLLSTVISVI